MYSFSYLLHHKNAFQCFSIFFLSSLLSVLSAILRVKKHYFFLLLLFVEEKKKDKAKKKYIYILPNLCLFLKGKHAVYIQWVGYSCFSLSHIYGKILYILLHLFTFSSGKLMDILFEFSVSCIHGKISKIGFPFKIFAQCWLFVYLRCSHFNYS